MPLPESARPIAKVLMVDDEPDIREVGQLGLQLSGGLSVLLACDGEEALDLAAREKPDVILLDVRMPRLDGPATFERLRASPATACIPVIFMTARVHREELDALLARGARGVIFKPFDPLSLSQEIGRIAGGG